MGCRAYEAGFGEAVEGRGVPGWDEVVEGLEGIREGRKGGRIYLCISVDM